MKRLLLLLTAVALATSTSFAAGLRTATLDVTKMDCAVCPITVRAALKKVPGVASARVDFATKRAVVVFDPTQASTEALTRATTDAGYPSSVKEVK